MFNHTMVYDGIQEADLAEACVELTVWDRDRLASNLLGGLRLGAGTGTGEKESFQNTQADKKSDASNGCVHHLEHRIVIN